MPRAGAGSGGGEGARGPQAVAGRLPLPRPLPRPGVLAPARAGTRAADDERAVDVRPRSRHEGLVRPGRWCALARGGVDDEVGDDQARVRRDQRGVVGVVRVEVHPLDYGGRPRHIDRGDLEAVAHLGLECGEHAAVAGGGEFRAADSVLRGPPIIVEGPDAPRGVHPAAPRRCGPARVLVIARVPLGARRLGRQEHGGRAGEHVVAHEGQGHDEDHHCPEGGEDRRALAPLAC